MADTALSAGRVRLAIFVLLLVELLSSLEASMMYTALPTIAREYGGMGSVTWLVSAFTLVGATTVALGARLGDMFGRRKVLLIILVIASTGSLISALTTNLALIIAGRAVQGLSAVLLPLCFGIAREIVAPARLPLVVGLLAGVYSASGALGFLLGGVLTQEFGWHSIFYVTVIVPWPIFALVMLFVPRGAAAQKPPSLDIAGALLLMPGLTGILLAVTYVATWPWYVTGLALVLAFAFLTAWARHEFTTAEPLIDVRLFRHRSVAMANLGFVFLGMGSMQMPLVVMMLIQQPSWTGVGLGIGAAAAGVLKLPSNLISAVAGPFAGWLGTRTSLRSAALVGGALGVAGWTGLSLWNSELWFVVAVSVVIGAGLAMTLATMPTVVLAAAPPERSSEVAGTLSVARTIGVATGAQVVSAVLAWSTVVGHGNQVFPDAEGFRVAFVSLALWATGGLLACAAIPRTRQAR